MGWSVERWILIGVYVIGVVAFIGIPARKWRMGHAVFLFHNMTSWLLGLTVVELGWLEYPVREMAYANGTSFVFEFLEFPVIAAYYNIYYPQGKRLLLRTSWLLLFAGGITVLEYFLEKYTRLIHYNSWTWYWTFLSVAAVLFLSRLFVLWFFREEQHADNV